MDYKKQLMDFAVDGKVTDIDYATILGITNSHRLVFKYYNKKLCLYAKVIIESENYSVDLYELAVKFIKRAK